MPPIKYNEPGSDDQFTVEQRVDVEHRYELGIAEGLEEDRKTSAQPTTDEDPSHDRNA
jgi:hypothetical protein